MPLGKEVDLGPGDIVLDGDPVETQTTQQPLPLSAHAYMAKRSPISATAELLFCLSDCLSVTLLNVRVCALDFAMKALEYRNDFDTDG